jgi:hypothetical protein
MSIYRLKLIGLGVAVGLALAGCTVPHVMGFGSYYQVTDPYSGKVYFTHQIEREDRGVVEFLDDSSDTWVSLPDGEVTAITEAEYQAGRTR